MRLKDYPVAIAEDVMKTYTHKGQGYPCACKCRDFLRDNELDVVYVSGNNRFPFLNVLANFAFYSGCLRKNVNLSGEEELLGEIKEKILKPLGFEGKLVPKNKGHGSILKLKKGGAYMARLLESMGLPRKAGRKAQLRNLELPDYRRNIFELAASGELDEKETEIVRKIEYDSAAVLFSSRMSIPSENHWVIYSFARPTKKQAEELTKSNVEMINFAVPDLELSEKDVKIQRLKSGSYSPRIIINGRKKECILDAHRDLLKFNSELKSRYGFELDFEPFEAEL